MKKELVIAYDLIENENMLSEIDKKLFEEAKDKRTSLRSLF